MSHLTSCIEQQLARVRSEAATGSRGSAQEMLGALVVDHATEIERDYRLLDAFVFTGFRIVHLQGIQDAVARHFPDLAGLDLGLSQTDPPGAQIVAWSVDGEGQQRFRFSTLLFALDDTSMYTITTRWLACLHIAQRHRKQARSSGKSYFDLGDWSSGLGLCFSDHRRDASLIPDSSFLASGGYQATRDAFARHAPCWTQRRPVAIWRGSSTGTVAGSLADTIRVKLCRLAQRADVADVIDAGITSVVQASSPEDAAALRDSGLCRPSMPMVEHADFRYQIDVDGNTNSWPGLFQKLLSGSPVLKVQSQHQYQQWYYSRLKPWYNYVPVALDLSDLLPVLRYLNRNDQVARSIGTAGRRLALEMTFDTEVKRSLDTIEAAFNRNAYDEALLTAS